MKTYIFCASPLNVLITCNGQHLVVELIKIQNILTISGMSACQKCLHFHPHDVHTALHMVRLLCACKYVTVRCSSSSWIKFGELSPRIRKFLMIHALHLPPHFAFSALFNVQKFHSNFKNLNLEILSEDFSKFFLFLIKPYYLLTSRIRSIWKIMYMLRRCVHWRHDFFL